MIEQAAYRIIGVNSRSSEVEIEYACTNKLQKVQRQLATDQALSIRQRAEQQIAQPSSAWEVLQKTPLGVIARPGILEDEHRNRSQAPLLHSNKVPGNVDYISWIWCL